MVNVTKTNYDTAMLVGARPNFVKVAPLLSKFEENNQKFFLFILANIGIKICQKIFLETLGLENQT